MRFYFWGLFLGLIHFSCCQLQLHGCYGYCVHIVCPVCVCVCSFIRHTTTDILSICECENDWNWNSEGSKLLIESMLFSIFFTVYVWYDVRFNTPLLVKRLQITRYRSAPPPPPAATLFTLHPQCLFLLSVLFFSFLSKFFQLLFTIYLIYFMSTIHVHPRINLYIVEEHSTKATTQMTRERNDRRKKHNNSKRTGVYALDWNQYAQFIPNVMCVCVYGVWLSKNSVNSITKYFENGRKKNWIDVKLKTSSKKTTYRTEQICIFSIQIKYINRRSSCRHQ